MGCCQSNQESNKDSDSERESNRDSESEEESQIDGVELELKTINDMIPQIDDAVRRLKALDLYATQEATEPLEVLVILANYHEYRLREKIAEYLSTIGYSELFIKITKSLDRHRILLQEDNEHERGVHNLTKTHSAFWNFTDVCPALGHDLGQYGGVEMLLNDIDVLGEFLSQSQVSEYIEAVLGILHNSIYHYSKNRPIYREARAVQILTKLLKLGQMKIKMEALLVLAHCVDEEESGILATAHGCVKLLTQMLGEAVKNEDHRTETDDNMVFSAQELLDGLNRLAMNDNNKSEIHKEGGIVSIIRLLQSDCSEEEQKLAAEALWNLSFVENIRTNTQIAECTPVLTELSKSQNKKLREASTFALWEIKDGDKEVLSAPSQCSEIPKQTSLPRGQHVMISYQWDSQDLAMKIRDNLKSAGFDVWMDVDKMKGNLLHAMAEAIENSAVVVVCMAQKYKESLNCRSEASYAYKKKKPITAILVEDGYEPDGWLGLLLGMQLYYNAFSSATLKKSMPSIITEIRDKNAENISGGVDVIDSPIMVSQQESQLQAAPSVTEQIPQSSSESEVKNWSTQRVKEWLKENGLDDLCSPLDFCDGKHLLNMCKRYKESSEAFTNDLKSDLKLSFIASVKFTTALENLLF